MSVIPIYTIGYGNRSIEDFIKLLQKYDIKFLVDLRSQPFSRYKPEFSKEDLEKLLSQQQIRYVYMGDTLGGRPKDISCYTDDGRVDYTILREKDFYKRGIHRLNTAWEKLLPMALMCSEMKPQECHRGKLIGNTLVEQGMDVRHIDENGNLKTQDEINQFFKNEHVDGQLSLFDHDSQVVLNEKSFFQALLDAKIDTFCDIRLRRGMRGSEYAFVNSIRLQQKLGELGIKYVHVKALAPTQNIRDKQKQEDEKLGVAKRARRILGQTFIHAYQQECLSTFDTSAFVSELGQDTQIIGLFCVEREPEACHRSLAAQNLAANLDVRVEHIKP